MYIHIIVSRANKTIMNLLLKVSRFFYDLQVNILLVKKNWFWKALLINYKLPGIGEFSSVIVLVIIIIIITIIIMLLLFLNSDFNRYY